LGFDRLASICPLELPVGGREFGSVEHGLCTAPQELGTVGAEFGGQIVELRHELVVELYEHLPSSHEHMVTHMATHMVCDAIVRTVRRN
jgi:hypothetical protein